VSRGERGYALLIALLVVALLSVALALIGLSLALRLRTAREEARGVTLTALCDAALAETLSGLAAGQAGNVAEHPLGSGTVASQVATIDAHHFRIRATARFEARARTVVADVVRDVSGTRVVHWQRLSG
jgi:type II secretory pathway component PulK